MVPHERVVKCVLWYLSAGLHVGAKRPSFNRQSRLWLIFSDVFLEVWRVLFSLRSGFTSKLWLIVLANFIMCSLINMFDGTCVTRSINFKNRKSIFRAIIVQVTLCTLRFRNVSMRACVICAIIVSRAHSKLCVLGHNFKIFPFSLFAKLFQTWKRECYISTSGCFKVN